MTIPLLPEEGTTVRVKQGDVGVAFTDTLAATDLGDLDDVELVRFLLIADDEIVLAAEASIIDPELLQVGYVSGEGDLDTAGLFEQAWELLFTTGERYTFPSATNNLVHVIAKPAVPDP